MLYVICTDKRESEMGPRGIILHKLIIECTDSDQANRAKCELEKRSERYKAIQLAMNEPNFDKSRGWYTSNKIAAPAFLQGR